MIKYRGMRNAYALLGLSFLVVFGGAYLLYERAQAPTPDDIPLEDNGSHTMAMELTSPRFEAGGTIPKQYSCDGDNNNPPLHIANVPEGTQSLALVMDDPDIPEGVKDAMGIEKFDHWVVYNIPSDTLEIPEGAQVGTLGNNSKGEAAYAGPCPPADQEPTEHRYIFRIYALPEELSFDRTPTLDEVEEAAEELSLGSAKLIGVYDRSVQ